MTDFTPGPWEVAHGGSYHRGEMVSEEWFVRRPDDDVAIAADIIEPYDSKPSKANARLIAQAPALFEALARMLEEAIARNPDDGDRMCLICGEINDPDDRMAFVHDEAHACYDAAAVLAAARGEQ